MLIQVPQNSQAIDLHRLFQAAQAGQPDSVQLALLKFHAGGALHFESFVELQDLTLVLYSAAVRNEGMGRSKAVFMNDLCY